VTSDARQGNRLGKKPAGQQGRTVYDRLARVQGGPPLIRLRRVSGARILRGVRTDHGGTAIITKAIHAAASSARFA
jgi:hypothetical protein